MNETAEFGDQIRAVVANSKQRVLFDVGSVQRNGATADKVFLSKVMGRSIGIGWYRPFSVVSVLIQDSIGNVLGNRIGIGEI